MRLIGRYSSRFITPDSTTSVQDEKGTLNTARAQISISGEGNVATVKGPGKITSIGIGGTGNRPLNVSDGATLIVTNLEIETEQNNGGSGILSENGNLDLTNVKMNLQ